MSIDEDFMKERAEAQAIDNAERESEREQVDIARKEARKKFDAVGDSYYDREKAFESLESTSGGEEYVMKIQEVYDSAYDVCEEFDNSKRLHIGRSWSSPQKRIEALRDSAARIDAIRKDSLAMLNMTKEDFLVLCTGRKIATDEELQRLWTNRRDRAAIFLTENILKKENNGVLPSQESSMHEMERRIDELLIRSDAIQEKQEPNAIPSEELNNLFREIHMYRISLLAMEVKARFLRKASGE